MSPHRYLLKITVFSLPLVIFFYSFGLWVSQLPSELLSKKHFFEQKIADIDTLVLGQDDAYHGIIAGKLSDRGFNLASPGQSIILDAKLVQKNISKLKSVQTVIFTISPSAYSSKIDKQAGSLKSFLYHQYFGVSEREHGWDHTVGLNIFGFFRNSFAIQLVADGLTRKVMEPAMDASGSAMSDISTQMASPMTTSKFTRMDWTGIEGTLKSLRKRKINVLFVSLPSMDKQSDQILRITYGFSNKYDIPYFNYTSDSRILASDFTPDGVLNRGGADKFTKILKDDLSEHLRSQTPEVTAPPQNTPLNIWSPDLNYFPKSSQNTASQS